MHKCTRRHALILGKVPFFLHYALQEDDLKESCRVFLNVNFKILGFKESVLTILNYSTEVQSISSIGPQGSL